MKRLTALFLLSVFAVSPASFALSAEDIAIDETNFPDYEFRRYISENLDSNNDGTLTIEEIANVKKIANGKEVKDNSTGENYYQVTYHISDAKGLEFFTAIKELIIQGDEKASLDKLDISNNTDIVSLDCFRNRLTELDVSKNINLKYLECSVNKLTTLDVSHNMALQFLGVYSNQLTTLNISTNASLVYVDCTWNKLTTLDVSNCTALTSLHCQDNLLTWLDLGNNVALKSLGCSNNQLIELNLSNNTKLESLGCSNTQISLLDLSNNIAVRSVNCDGNENLVSIDLGIAHIEELYCSDNPRLIRLEASNVGIANPTLADFSIIECCRNEKLIEVKVGENLQWLECHDNPQLVSLDVSRCTCLGRLYCQNNCLKKLDLSNNINFAWISGINLVDCSNNQLIELKLSGSQSVVKCSHNQLSELDFSNIASIGKLDCSNNRLTALDIHNCSNLTLGNITADSTVRIIHGTRDDLPSFTDHSLILSGQLGLDFYANVPASTNTNGAYTDFTVNSKTGSPEMFSNAVKVGDDYRFTCYINSVQMADTITAMFCYSDDTKNMAAVQDCRVTDYLDAIISSTDLSAKSPDLVALAEAIKDYGHYVQIPLSRYNSWDIGTDHAEIECANQNIDSDSADVKTKLQAYALNKDIEGSGIENLTYDLELDSEITLNIYLTPGNDAGNVSAYITDDYGDFDGKTNMAVYDSSENAYVVTIGGISAHKLGRFYTVSITTGKGSGFTVKMSALSYANGVMQAENDGENIDDDLKRAVISLYKYYAATMKYRGETLSE